MVVYISQQDPQENKLPALGDSKEGDRVDDSGAMIMGGTDPVCLYIYIYISFTLSMQMPTAFLLYFCCTAGNSS